MMTEVFNLSIESMLIQVFRNEQREYAVIIADHDARTRNTIFMNNAQMLDLVIALKHSLS